MQLHKRNKIYLLTAGYFHMLHISLLQAAFLHPPRQPCLRCFHELTHFILVMDYNACQSLGTLTIIRPANSHGFAVCLTVLASISRSHEFVFISHGFSKTYFQFTNAAIFKMFRFYLAFPLQILCMILCKISLFCVIVLESTALLTSLVGLE